MNGIRVDFDVDVVRFFSRVDDTWLATVDRWGDITWIVLPKFVSEPIPLVRIT